MKNREIKFRGKRKSDVTWLYGSLINNMFVKHATGEPCCVIVDTNEYEYDCHQDIDNSDLDVINNTIGQFTGLKDKNGVDIYEGDIVKTDFKKDGSYESIQVIEFYEGSFGSRNKEDHFRIPALFSGRATECMNTNYYEVIGNIHENPELLNT